MSCPAPEELSRWNDGAADLTAAAALKRHVESCEACRARVESFRAAARWIETLAEPGPDCLSAEEMAALIDGGRGATPHVRLCPRCAAEYKALRPAKKATHRIYRSRSVAAPWIAAAAALVLAVVGLIVGLRPRTSDNVASRPLPAPPKPLPAPLPEPMPEPKAPEPATLPEREPIKPLPLPPTPRNPEDPTPAPKTPEPVVPPAPEPPKPSVPPTIVEPAHRAVAVAIKAGALAVQQGTKWVKASRPEEGQTLRAEGRTVCEFAGATLTLEASSRVEFQSFDIALHEGGLSADVASGSPFVLSLGGQRIEPFASSRVMMVARPDKVVVEEGAAKAGGAVLQEGVEYAVKKDRFEAQKRRSLPAAARAREQLTWKMDFSQPALLRPRIVQGRLSVEGEERFLAAGPLGDNAFWQGQVGYFTGDVQKPLFVVKPGTTLRFRYYLSQPAPIELVLKNITKDENYNKPLESVAGRWTTVTIPVREVPPNRGGKQVPCELGDRYVGWGVFVGRPGSTAELYVDQLEILEVDR